MPLVADMHAAMSVDDEMAILLIGMLLRRLVGSDKSSI